MHLCIMFRFLSKNLDCLEYLWYFVAFADSLKVLEVVFTKAVLSTCLMDVDCKII